MGLRLFRSFGVCLSLIIVAWLTGRIVWWLHAITGIALESGWIAYTTSVVLLPTAAMRAGADTDRVLIVLLTGIVATYLWGRFNAQEVVLLSAYVRDTSDPSQAAKVATCRRLLGTCGAISHLFALLISWSACDLGALMARYLSNDQAYSRRLRALVAITVYLIVIAGWITRVLSERFSFRRWRSMLSENRQIVEQAETDAELNALLRTIRNRLLARELGYQLLVTLAMVVMIPERGLEPSGYPLSLLLVFGTFMFVDRFDLVASQFHRFLISRAPVTHKVLDLSQLPEASEKQGFLGRLNTVMGRSIAIAGGVWTVLQVLDFFLGIAGYK
jgi:hypothetical protein